MGLPLTRELSWPALRSPLNKVASNWDTILPSRRDANTLGSVIPVAVNEQMGISLPDMNSGHAGGWRTLVVGSMGLGLIVTG
jgi:hypothetical protein